MVTDIEHKKLILDKIVGAYYTEGPLPTLNELNSCISQMDPRELAHAIYLLEYSECVPSLARVQANSDEKLQNQVFFSKGLKNDIEKIFMAVAEHFRRMPGEASSVVDEIFHYFYKAIICLTTKQGLISNN
jgi:hypothetical protein